MKERTMALSKRKFIQSFIIVSALVSCAAKYVQTDHLHLCINDSVSCSARFLNYTNAGESDCRLAAYRGNECRNKEFKLASASLGSVKLKVYLYFDNQYFPTFNITFSDIKWTVMNFRFSSFSEDTTFCREYHISPKHNIPELFYDCLTTISLKEGYDFYFEYQAEDDARNIDGRKFIVRVPLSKYMLRTDSLEKYSPFLYVDITDLPVLKAHWQQVPFGILEYRVEIFELRDDSERHLIHSAIVEGTDDPDEQLTYRYNTFLTSGKIYVKVTAMNDSCPSGLCGYSVSPEIIVGDIFTRSFVIGIVGCVVLVPLFLFILYMWKRQCCSANKDTKLPVVLIIHTPSRATHFRAVVALTEYLRNHCFVEALLDQLDIPDSETKDPWLWYNRAFSRADFVMIVSSPHKCCSEEGIFINLEKVALRFLKEKFCSRSAKPRLFAVQLPYCTKEDLPEEAQNLRTFKLTKQLDGMLWFIHNGGRFPTVMDSFQMLFGPKPLGGKSDLNTKGMGFLSILEEAKYDKGKVCNCKDKKRKESEVETEDENMGLIKMIPSFPLVEEKEVCLRNVSESGSSSCLLPESETFGLCPNIKELDLLGEKEELPIVVVERSKAAKEAGFDVQSLPL